MKNVLVLKQAGDTIVEVLVVLAVVGSALSISYAIANHSLVGVRQSHEHSEALQLVQGQLEELRAYVASNSSQIINASAVVGTADFCFDPADATTINLINSADLQDSPNDTANHCQADNLYNLDIICKPLSGSDCTSGGTYTVQAGWANATGDGQDNVSLVYRYYP